MRILAVVLMCAVLAGSAAAADEKAAEMTPEQMQMMKAYEAAAKPGAEHAMLAKSAGRWNCTVKSWMDPKAEPEVTEGTQESEVIFDGRFVVSRFKGSMMGKPFEGMGTLGYDNVKKKYVGTWLDSMGTGIMSYEGDYNPGAKEMVCHGKFMDAATGKEQTCRMVSRLVSDDQTVFEMWGPDPAGQDVKWMEITYNRAK